MDAEDLAAACDVVAITVPLHVTLAIDPEALRGAIVLDATNPWGEADVAAARAVHGDLAGELSTSELLAAHLSGSRVVKTLNHIGYDGVTLGGLAAGLHLEPGAGLFGGWSAQGELHRRHHEHVRVP